MAPGSRSGAEVPVVTLTDGGLVEGGLVEGGLVEEGLVAGAPVVGMPVVEVYDGVLDGRGVCSFVVTGAVAVSFGRVVSALDELSALVVACVVSSGLVGELPSPQEQATSTADKRRKTRQKNSFFINRPP